MYYRVYEVSNYLESAIVSSKLSGWLSLQRQTVLEDNLSQVNCFQDGGLFGLLTGTEMMIFRDRQVWLCPSG
jgi:hypothetical protein